MRSFFLSAPAAALFVCQLLAMPAMAAEAPPLTLDAARQLALQTNPELRAADGALAVADGLIQQAGAYPNPTLSLLSEGLHQTDGSRTLQLNQTIELGGKRGARVDAAASARALEQAGLEQRRSALAADVGGAFFDVLAAQQHVQQAQAGQQLARSALDAAARRVGAGKVAPLEQVRANVVLATSAIELNQANTELALARRKLAATWGGADTDRPLVAPASAAAPHPSLDELLSHLPDAPELLSARAAVTHRQALADVERSKRLPDLTVSVGRKRDEAGRQLTVVGLSVPLPLFDSNHGNLLAALRQTDQARDNQDAVRQRLTLALSEAYLRRQAANTELDLLRSDVLPAAQQARAAAGTGFALGKFSFLDVLDAQRTLFATQAQWLRALAERHRADMAIDALLGPTATHAPRATPATPF